MTKKYSFLKMIGLSLDTTVTILFRPFRLKMWIMLGLIVFLAGQLGGGNLNLSTKFNTGGEHKIRKVFEDKGVVPEISREDLKEQVTQLLAETHHVVVVQGLQHLVGLFQKRRAKRPMGLITIPRAPPGSTEVGHDLLERGQ